MDHFENLITKIQNELPDLITCDQLLRLGIGSHVSIFRLRQKNVIPYIKTSSARILFLKNDVIDWLKKSYTVPKEDICFTK